MVRVFLRFYFYLRVYVHGVDEHAQPRGGLGHLRHHVDRHVGVFYVRLYLLEYRRGNVVLTCYYKRGKERSSGVMMARGRFLVRAVGK